MNKLFAIGAVIAPVLLAWALGYFKIPDAVDLIEYSSSGTELINLQDKLASSLKIQANDKPVEKLSIHTVHFANTSSKNLQKFQVAFEVKTSPDTELVASAIKGPKNYSDSLIKRVDETKMSATYVIDFVNVQTNGDYFTASFLLSGSPPESITPISLTPGVGFLDVKKNWKTDAAAAGILISIFVGYALILWQAYRRGKKQEKARQEKFEQNLTSYFASNFSLTPDQACERTKELSVLRDSVFKPENWLKKWLKTWLA